MQKLREALERVLPDSQDRGAQVLDLRLERDSNTGPAYVVVEVRYGADPEDSSYTQDDAVVVPWYHSERELERVLDEGDEAGTNLLIAIIAQVQGLWAES